MTLLAPFEVHNDKGIQDFNYEVDALEDEHVRREVHTTKVVIEDKSSKVIGGDPNYIESVAKDNKRVRKARTKFNHIKKIPVQIMNQEIPVKTQMEEIPVPINIIKEKREHKKSFDFYNVDDRSENAGESPFSIQPKFNPLAPRSLSIQ